MSGRNWIQELRDDLERQRIERERYFKAFIFAVSALFDAGHPDKGKEAMKMAGLPLEDTPPPSTEGKEE